MTKAYTLNRLINEVSNLNYRQVKDFNTFVQAVSPRAGIYGRKVEVLDNFLGGHLNRIINSPAFGKTPRTRVLNALRARKKGITY